MHTKVYTETQ